STQFSTNSNQRRRKVDAQKNKLTLVAKGDREIVMTRSFDAPRHLVFDAFTKPELVRQWLPGPPGWPMPVCQTDLRVGGKSRGVAASYDRLEDVLATAEAKWRRAASGRSSRDFSSTRFPPRSSTSSCMRPASFPHGASRCRTRVS